MRGVRRGLRRSDRADGAGTDAGLRTFGVGAGREAWRAGQERRQGVLDFAARLGADLDGLDWTGRRNLLPRLGATARLHPEDGTGNRWDLTTRWCPAGAPTVLLDEGTGVGRVRTERDGAPVTAVVGIAPGSFPYVGDEELAAIVAGIDDDRAQARAVAAWERGAPRSTRCVVLGRRHTLRRFWS